MNITILGAGFAGVKSALELARDRRNKITVITDKEDFQYYPTLYSSATGHSHLESWVSLGEIFANEENVQVLIDRIVGIDNEKKELVGVNGIIYPYTTLLIAVGAVTTYFGIPGLDQYAYGIKSASEIRQLKERIYQDIAEEGKLDHNYIVVGGGPTGVELAGALGTYLRRLSRHYNVHSSKVSIRLIEAADRLLPRSHPAVSKRALKRLEKLGVSVQVGAKVESANAESIIVSGHPVASHTVIWTSGVANNPLFAAHSNLFKLARNGKVEVDEYLLGARDIYVLGDNAATPFSGLAQTALHDAKFVARNIMAKKRGKSLKKYRAVQPPSVVPIGSNWAAFEWKWLRLYGWPAAFVRRAADFIGYSDILPFGQAIRPWHAARLYEHDYFTPSHKKPLRKTYLR